MALLRPIPRDATPSGGCGGAGPALILDDTDPSLG
eukprot:gene10050-1812_t